MRIILATDPLLGTYPLVTRWAQTIIEIELHLWSCLLHVLLSELKFLGASALSHHLLFPPYCYQAKKTLVRDDSGAEPKSQFYFGEESKISDLDAPIDEDGPIHLSPKSLKINRMSVEQIDKHSEEISTSLKSTKQIKSPWRFPINTSYKKSGSLKRDLIGSEGRISPSLCIHSTEGEGEKANRQPAKSTKTSVSLRFPLRKVKSFRTHLGDKDKCLEKDTSPLSGRAKRSVSFKDSVPMPIVVREVNLASMPKLQVACLPDVYSGGNENFKTDSDSCPVGVKRCIWLSGGNKLTIPEAAVAKGGMPNFMNLDFAKEAVEDSGVEILNDIDGYKKNDPHNHGPRPTYLQLRRNTALERYLDKTPPLLTSRFVILEKSLSCPLSWLT